MVRVVVELLIWGTETEGEKKQIQNALHPWKSTRIRHQVMSSTGVGADTLYRHVACDINIDRV